MHTERTSAPASSQHGDGEREGAPRVGDVVDEQDALAGQVPEVEVGGSSAGASRTVPMPV
jgi:hypothetical protein